MNGNIRAGNLFGIPFYINPSWFFVLALMALTYGGELSRFPGSSGIGPWLWGFAAALLLFASVIAHELGHSAVALARGIEVKSITLFLFGGMAVLGREAKTPGEAFLVAVAGPLVSFLLAGVFLWLGTYPGWSGPGAAIVSLLAYLNLVLGAFNLIPGLPLDGGNILKAIVWQVTGDPNRGVLFASRFGQFFGWLAIVLGALSIAGITTIGSGWTLLIGIFLLQSAGFSARGARLQALLGRYTAKDALSPDPTIVSASLSLREFVNERVIGRQPRAEFLVTDADGKLSGTIAVDDVRGVPTSRWPSVKVGDLLRTGESWREIPTDRPLTEVVKIWEGENPPRVVVVETGGEVVGSLEKGSLLEFLSRETTKKRHGR